MIGGMEAGEVGTDVIYGVYRATFLWCVTAVMLPLLWFERPISISWLPGSLCVIPIVRVMVRSALSVVRTFL